MGAISFQRSAFGIQLSVTNQNQLQPSALSRGCQPKADSWSLTADR
jgi:hypothetical protein